MAQKILTLMIPCFNSQDYMENCINSLIVGEEDIEILIVNDGSTDGTAQIADDYAARYPGIIRVIHQKNGGHGAAVNAGLAQAQGQFFKVVDSDDWVEPQAYAQVLKVLRTVSQRSASLDMLITNFVYENEAVKNKKNMHYVGILPENRLFTWNEVQRFHKGHYMLMHSLIYRTEILLDSGLKLPEHTFYVDNIYAYIPLPYVRNMYYLNADFYRYFIGRVDQSVNENNMIDRIDQQLLVNKIMMDQVNLWSLPSKKMRQYMLNYLEIVTTISSVIALCSASSEDLQKKDALWHHLKSKDARTYKILRHGMMGILMNLPGKAGRKLAVALYHLTQKRIGFN